MKLYKKMKIRISGILLLCFLLAGNITGCGNSNPQAEDSTNLQRTQVPATVTTTPPETEDEYVAESETSEVKVKREADALSPKKVPDFSNVPYVEINENIPNFPKSDFTKKSFEKYSSLDELGRCQVAYANIGQDLMPTEKRGRIGQVKPSGWKLVKYDNVDGKYLYNRCHLIGYQLTGENANEKNLITGTRYLNVDGMLPFENMVADYIKETGNHVLYRVTPIFKGNNLVADGVQMEAESVEDQGAGICYNIFAYNNQPGITIDYKNGDSHLNQGEQTEEKTEAKRETKTNENVKNNTSEQTGTYVLNTNTKKFHKPTCASVSQTSDKNRKNYTGSREGLISEGYEPCKRCNP